MDAYCIHLKHLRIRLWTFPAYTLSPFMVLLHGAHLLLTIPLIPLDSQKASSDTSSTHQSFRLALALHSAALVFHLFPWLLWRWKPFAWDLGSPQHGRSRAWKDNGFQLCSEERPKGGPSFLFLYRDGEGEQSPGLVQCPTKGLQPGSPWHCKDRDTWIL